MDTGQLSERRAHARWMLGSGGLQALVGLGTNLLLMRLLAPAEFGRFALAFATIALVFALASLRLGPVVQRSSDAELRGGFGPLAAGAILLESALAGLLALVLLALGDAIGALSLTLLATCTITHALTQLRGFVERGSPYAQLARIEGSAQAFGSGAALVGAVCGLGAGALALRELALVAVQATGLGLLLRERPELRPPAPRLPRPLDLPRLFARSSDSALDGLLEGLVARLSVLAAGALGGAAGAGYLAQAQRLAVVPHQLLGPLCGRLAFQWFARTACAAERAALQARLLRKLFPWLAAAAAGAVILGPSLIPWVFGSAWRPTALLLVALVGVVAGMSPLALLRMRLLAERRLGGLLAQRGVQLGALGLGFVAASAASGPQRLGWLAAGLSLGTLGAAWIGALCVRTPATAPAQVSGSGSGSDASDLAPARSGPPAALPKTLDSTADFAAGSHAEQTAERSCGEPSTPRG